MTTNHQKKVMKTHQNKKIVKKKTKFHNLKKTRKIKEILLLLLKDSINSMTNTKKSDSQNLMSTEHPLGQTLKCLLASSKIQELKKIDRPKKVKRRGGKQFNLPRKGLSSRNNKKKAKKKVCRRTTTKFEEEDAKAK